MSQRHNHQKDKHSKSSPRMGGAINKLMRYGNSEYYKEKREALEKYEYFWLTNDIYSQWHPSRFNVDGMDFSCAEQYMMYCKAGVADDKETQMMILATRSPREMKKYGKNVKGLNHHVWQDECIDVVRIGNVAKFSQNNRLKERLFATYPKLLVEASPYDMKWGIGLHSKYREAFHKEKWNGLNLLGYIITDVRDELMLDEKHDIKRTVNLEKVKQSLRDFVRNKHFVKSSNADSVTCTTEGEDTKLSKSMSNCSSNTDSSKDNHDDLGAVGQATIYIKQQRLHEEYYLFTTESEFALDYMSPFHSEQDNSSFDSVRQFLVYRKADLYKDKNSKKKALNAEDRNRLDAIEKNIKVNDDDNLWNECILEVYKSGNLIKFESHDSLKKKLFETYPKPLVFADEEVLWGTGVIADDPVFLEPAAWPGYNLYGLVLTAVRNELMEKEHILTAEAKPVCLRDLKMILFEIKHPSVIDDEESDKPDTITSDREPMRHSGSDRMEQTGGKVYPGRAERMNTDTGGPLPERCDASTEDKLCQERADGEVQVSSPRPCSDPKQNEDNKPRVELTEKVDAQLNEGGTTPKMETDLKFV